jgi:formate hydrogenlyase subunit 6/NADH:ubiquinone oxidoreductase subunit I
MKMPGVMLGEVLRNVTKEPATTSYPATAAQMPQNFRGKILFIAEKCVGCKLCVKDCPSMAITINKVGNKRFEAVFDLDRCIYCAQCVDSCNKDALEATQEFELAVLSRAPLHITFQAPPEPPPPPPKPVEPAAVVEAKPTDATPPPSPLTPPESPAPAHDSPSSPSPDPKAPGSSS